jgi:polysaccharide deacetylase 2 family uncharacterized protein YibQ
MTKLKNMVHDEAWEHEPRSTMQWGMFGGILAAAAAILLVARVGETPEKPLTEIAQKLRTDLQQRLADAPSIFPALRLGDWPLSFRFHTQATRFKSEPQFISDGRPVIAVVIDDCGNDDARTREAIALPREVTLSVLPYPDATYLLSHRAKMEGHEVIVHLPMQPVGNQNPGPRALVAGLSSLETKRRVDWALSRVADYDGVNNHMGSRLTASHKALVPVMQELAEHGLFFLDSRTTSDTVAETTARQAGMLAGARDVFLDDDESAPAVERQLAQAEAKARATGSAIAIGHPHPQTLEAVAAWASKVEARGFRLVTLKQALELRSGKTHEKISGLMPSD